MGKELIRIDPRLKYWRVTLYETIGFLNVECTVTNIPAETKMEALEKAVRQYLATHKDGEPRFKSAELEAYSRPIQI